MKVIQTVSFTHEVEGRLYHLSFPVPAPLVECYNVCATVLGELEKKMKEAQEAEAAAKVDAEALVEAAEAESIKE